jgi:hypothetical protein
MFLKDCARELADLLQLANDGGKKVLEDMNEVLFLKWSFSVACALGNTCPDFVASIVMYTDICKRFRGILIIYIYCDCQSLSYFNERYVMFVEQYVCRWATNIVCFYN